MHYDLYSLFNQCTHGSRYLTTLLVKYINDLLDGESSERSRNEVTFFYVGGVLCIHLGSKYADFQEKIFAEISGKKYQTFHCSNVTTMKSFLKIGILRAKVYTKNTPNIEECNFIPVLIRPLNTRQVIEVLY